MTGPNQPKPVEDVDDPPSVAELRQEQRREIEHVGFGTEGQTHGAVFGALGGAVIGAILGLVVALVWFDADSATRVLAPVMAALAGSVAGFVYWGSRTPDLEDETQTATGAPSSGSTPEPGDRDTDEPRR